MICNFTRKTVIEPTEALVVIDVNTGKFMHKKNIEETALFINKEASKEIAKQLRLRNLSGIIIVDFIIYFHTIFLSPSVLIMVFSPFFGSILLNLIYLCLLIPSLWGLYLNTAERYRKAVFL